MDMKIYYEDQNGWSDEQFCYLHRYLHRMLYYYQKYRDEISSLDTEKMTEKTKVLIYCIIKYYGFEFMFDDYKNLSSIREMKPLKKKLILDDTTLQEDDIYKKMNVVY